jgi:hypothetical protein
MDAIDVLPLAATCGFGLSALVAVCASRVIIERREQRELMRQRAEYLESCDWEPQYTAASIRWFDRCKRCSRMYQAGYRCRCILSRRRRKPR